MTRELIAAEIGRRLGLSIPVFRLAKFPDYSDWHGFHPEAGDIGDGLVFASQEVENAIGFQFSKKTREAVEKTADRILLFDWWIHNEDRGSTNPNLLFANGIIHVIDHNLAFDGDDPLNVFLKKHIFGDRFNLFGFDREHSEAELDEIMKSWDEICGMVPSEWLESCSDGAIILDKIHKILARYKTEPTVFWKL